MPSKITTNTEDFTGQDFFIGLDVHKNPGT